MKRIAIVLALAAFFVAGAWAQDNTGSGSNSSDNTAAQNSTTTTTTTDQDNTTAQNDATRKRAAAADENAADAAKANAKDAGSPQGEDRDKAIARLDDAAKDLNELLGAPDKGIPDQVFTKAKCVAVIPSMIKGGFIFGAEHGRGVASCRLPDGTWSAPAFFVATGGSWGAQIGAEGVDLVMLIMNDNGMNQLLSSKFKIGANASAAAGPVGRQAAADTNWKMDAEVLTYSRARGLFAGATLNGVVVKADDDSMRAYYGRTVGFRPVLTGQVKDVRSNDAFLAALQRNRAEVNAQAH